MGTIQNSVNNMLGTAAAAAAAGKHISNQNKEAAIKASENITETVDAAQNLDTDYNEQKKLQDLYKKDVEKYDEQFNDLVLNGSPESRIEEAVSGKEAGERKLNEQKDEVMRKRMGAQADVEMLQKSLDEVALKRDAKRLQAEIYQKQINAVGNNGKDMGIYNLPWEDEAKSKLTKFRQNRFGGNK